MRSRDRHKMFPAAALFIAMLMFMPVFAGNPAAGQEITVDTQKWPMWPEPSRQINEIPLQEPATFLSIGREVVPWPFFGDTTVDNDGYMYLVGSDLFFTIEEFTISDDAKAITGYSTVRPAISQADDLFMVLGNTTWKNPTNSWIRPELTAASVFPEYQGDWIRYGDLDVTEVPNENFLARFPFDDQETYLNAWRNFLIQNQYIGDEDFPFVDSGHAPPQMIWPVDPWLYSYRSKTGYESGPAAWKDRYVCFWPTNQGALQAFEAYNVDVPDSTPYVNRTWLAVPNPSFRQAVYSELRKTYMEGSRRMTVLDGPVTIRDVEIDGQWSRIAVGTTGIGTKQVPKPQDAWETLRQSDYNPTTAAPTVSESGKGRAFGVYAFEVTELGETPTEDALETLWSVSNVSFTTSARSFSVNLPENSSGAEPSEYAAFADLKFSVSKPLIGYTKDGSGNRTWHAVILGVDESDRYKWIDADPTDGSVRRTGYFINGYTGNAERVEVFDSVTYGSLTGEEVENVFPSRILSAFPPSDSEYQEPLLSDVYVHLSNGAVYSWDLNPEETAPEWIVTFRCERGGQIAPPMTDFDISYVEGSTYIATNAFVRNVQGQAEQDTEALIIANLTNIAKLSAEERNSITVPPGREGSVIDASNTDLMVLQLEGLHGAYSPDSKTVLASPVFIAKRLYLAFYELTRTGRKFNASRLYAIDFLNHEGKNSQISEASTADELAEGKERYDFTNEEAVMMFVDSQGNLVLLDADGNVIGQPIPTGLELAQDEATGTGTGPFSGPGVHLVYWKTN